MKSARWDRLLIDEQRRSDRYFERMNRTESNLAEIRARLGVSNKPNRFTMYRIDDLQEMAAKWVQHLDYLTGRPKGMVSDE